VRFWMKPLPNGAVITARNSVNNASGLWKSNIGKLFCDTFTGFQYLSMNHSWLPENVFDCNLSRRFHIFCRILGLFDAFYLKRSVLDRGDAYHATPCTTNALKLNRMPGFTNRLCPLKPRASRSKGSSNKLMWHAWCTDISSRDSSSLTFNH